MNRIMKVAMSIVMSFAMVLCLASTGARAKTVSAQEDGISPQRFIISQEYCIKDNYEQITAFFASSNQLIVQCKNLKGQARYYELVVSTPSKTFSKRKFTLKKGQQHSEMYKIDAFNTSKVTITLYPHTSTSPSSGHTDPLTGVMRG